VGWKAFEVDQKVGGAASENDWKGGKLSKLTSKKRREFGHKGNTMNDTIGTRTASLP